MGYNNGNHQGVNQEQLVYGQKLSSIGPAKVTGDVMYEPSNIDLAMKLHYLKVVYLFEKEAMEGLNLTVIKLKEALFTWLNYYYETCGRFRRSEDSGQAYMKCNDCGIRFLEVKSHLAIDEWLNLPTNSLMNLVPRHFIGPELNFSPPCFLQITTFKCGGMSLGLSWAHILGDAFSLANFMKFLGPFLEGIQPNYPPSLKKSPPNIPKPTKQDSFGPLTVKKVGPVGENWVIDPPCEMDYFCFHLPAQTLTQLQMKMAEGDRSHGPIQPFESVAAVIWRAMAKVMNGSEPNVVAVLKPGPKPDNLNIRNNQRVCSVKADFPVVETNLIELATMIRDQAHDETAQIAEMVDENPGESDFVLYGTNPTFVDWGEAEFYGFKVKGMGPKLVNCFVEGLGENGVVLVLPGPNSMENGDEGRLVTLLLPKSYMDDLKEELKKEWPLID